MFLVEKYGHCEHAMSLVVRSLGGSMSREDLVSEYREYKKKMLGRPSSLSSSSSIPILQLL
jgi:hypothetical protein